MNINSTEDERYLFLKNKNLCICEISNCPNIILKNSNDSISSCISQYARDLNLIGSLVDMPDFKEGFVKFTKRTIGESIANICKQNGNLFNFVKLLSCFDDVVSSAIKIDIEEYRHKTQRKNEIVKCMHHYISAFCDDKNVYPVKITIEERVDKDNTNIHIILTMGEIKKEALSNVRMQSQRDESVTNRVTSFIISLSDFVKFFNREQGTIIKNLPDKMLSDSQKKIKYKIIDIDNKKEKRYIELQNKIQELKQELNEINESYDVYFEELDERE